MILLNFAHPMTPEQLQSLAQALGAAFGSVMEIKTHFDPARPYAEQSKALIDTIGWSPSDWQTVPFVINPPSLAILACVVLAELHGRTGYFPPVVRLRPVANATPPRFEFAEVVNLQTIREEARAER